ncbi:hypothetical protein SAMN06272735_8839 [Streptomyces sp. TLI_55]|uniref:hypothetical protein n=1 Tax=Streptomyces sp. TLI_55 TaxID=1938861 RepID=UPI000BD54E71|nr:hypothetical protein [Streptomyces sp. TLI_55]SNX88393.1 hypothetical protein SAMN06272735_8839 [Streptomyces sp. TLI_55]
MTDPTLARRGRVLGAAALLSCAALLLTGCGDSTDDASQRERQDVASLQSGAPAGQAGVSVAPDADAGRPQLRLDSSDAERDHYWHLYATCLKDHGHKMLPQRGPDSVDDTDQSPTAKAATKACAGKLPLQPPELERSTNPHYDDDYRAYVKCLNREGLKVHALPDNSGWTYDGDTTMSQTRQTEVDKSCTMEAFGGTTR